MSGSTDDNGVDSKQPSETETLPTGLAEQTIDDPEAAPPDTIPPDLSNRTLVDEEGPF